MITDISSLLISPFSARAVQVRRGETGPLSPDHLREAYRGYQEETGHVGAARPLRAKKLFVR
jgi:transcription initiation factor TFIID subunit 11